MTDEIVETRTEITEALLGLRPFVLIEGTGYDEETDGLTLGVQFGGGVGSPAEAREVLQLAVDGLTEQIGDEWPRPEDEEE